MRKFSRKQIIFSLLIILLFIAGIFLSTQQVKKRQTIDSQAAQEKVNLTPSVQKPPPSDYSTIRSVTFYDFGVDDSSLYTDIERELPKIKENGFNTLWFVSPWKTFNPSIEPLQYNEQAFEELIRRLNLLRANKMRAILGLNYLGKGWEPKGVDACNWIQDEKAYKAFENYTITFLSKIKDYSQMTYILFFTEGAEPCGNEFGNAVDNARLLQNKLGSLPERLPKDLRKAFRFGYHDKVVSK